MKHCLACILLLLCSWSTLTAQDKYIKAGDKLMERQEFLEALEKYQISYFYNADYLSTKKIAEAYFALQRHKDAINWYTQTTKNKEVNWEDYLQLAKSALIERDFLIALNAAKKAVIYNPGNKDLQLLQRYIEHLYETRETPEKARDKEVEFCINIDLPSDPQQVGAQVKYEWLFDDGLLKRGNTVNHCFEKGGKHTIKLSSVDDSFGVMTKQDTVLEVFFYYETDFKIEGIGWVNSAVKYDPTKAVDAKNVAGYIWETGDGNILFDGTSVYKYATPGQYKVKLTVFFQDSAGNRQLGGTLAKTWVVVNR